MHVIVVYRTSHACTAHMPMQVAAAAAAGPAVEFRVEPRAFLVHRPHARSGAKQELGGETAAYRCACACG